MAACWAQSSRKFGYMRDCVNARVLLFSFGEVFKLVIESKPQREQMKAAIQALSKRVASVEASPGLHQASDATECK